MQNNKNIGAVSDNQMKDFLLPLLGSLGFKTDAQHDAQEFMIGLLNFIESQIPGAMKSFQVQTLRTITATDGSKDPPPIKTSLETAPMIQLAAKDGSGNEISSLGDALKKFIEKELMTGDNQVKFSDGIKMDAESVTKIESVPAVVLFQFNRFQNDGRASSKLNHPIDIPFELDLRPYCSNNLSVNLELFAVIQHGGGVSGGHYFAHVRDNYSNKWICFNDSMRSFVNDNEAMKKAFNENAYVVAYRRKK
jgi:ubiquitin C-terminal hydrolase